MDINFELYKIFYHAAKSGNFSDAAEKLYITQSAVSQAIKNLEEKTGSRLFYRKSRSVRLTNEGELLFKHIEQAYNFIKAAEDKLFEIQNMDSGEVRVGVSDTVCKYFLIPYLDRFTKQYPKVKIKVVNRITSQITDLLKNGIVDFGIITLPAADKSIKTEEFLTVEDIFVASDKYSHLKGKEISLQELFRNPILSLPVTSATRRNLDTFLNRMGLNLIPEIELESVDLLAEFARIGLGVAHVLKESAAVAIEKNELFKVETIEKLPLRMLGIITVESVPVSRASGRFISFLKSNGSAV